MLTASIGASALANTIADVLDGPYKDTLRVYDAGRWPLRVFNLSDLGIKTPKNQRLQVPSRPYSAAASLRILGDLIFPTIHYRLTDDELFSIIQRQGESDRQVLATQCRVLQLGNF